MLCRRAFELGFATSYMFAGSRPIFKQVGEITFKKPVDVGDLLSLHSTVLYTHQDPSTGQVSMSFSPLIMGRFTFCFAEYYPVIQCKNVAGEYSALQWARC